MEYYVIADDGNRYGPADLPTLNSWIQQGRLLPQTTLENAATGVQSKANMTAGLVFAAVPPTFSAAPPARSATMYSAAPPQRVSDGKDYKQALGSIGLGILAIVCVFTIGIGGLIFGVPAIRVGYSAVSNDENYVGVVGIVLGIVAIGLWIAVRAHVLR